MSLNVNDELTINGVTYRVTPPPTAPGFFHSRTAAIYHLLPAPALALPISAWGIAEHAVHQLPGCRDVSKAAKS